MDSFVHGIADFPVNRAGSVRLRMPRWGVARALGVLFISLLAGSATAVSGDVAGEAESSHFEEHVRPILEAKCYRCHNDQTQKAELNLSTPAGIEKGGESGATVDRENPEESTLFQYVHERLMPPEGEGKLSDAEVQAICQWIEAKAPLKQAEAAQAEGVTQHDALPILLLHCATCHGAQRQRADLDIRSKTALVKGGKTGPAIVPGKPEESLLLKRIHDLSMPPRKELVAYSVKPVSPQELETLTEWIAAGAPEVQLEPDVATTQPDPLVSDEDRQFWSFQPPRAADVPQVLHPDRTRHPIDAFVLKKLDERGLNLSPAAARRTLIRRACFDLIGLPPEPSEVEAFLADSSPDAYERRIDRLLASPQFGERWAQYWLDLSGYADSEGIVNADVVRQHAWRYRDYVIQAFNSDKPYDRFLLEQLAGDELADYEHAAEITQEIYDNLVATGFLRMAPDGTYEPLTGFMPDRLEMIDDELEVLGSAVLGLTIKCARCHTHKFDPIPQRDYYRLADLFKGALDENDWLVANSQGADSPSDAKLRCLSYVTADERARAEAAGDQSPHMIRALWDRGEPSPTYILKRGNYLDRGRLVGPGVPSVLTDGKTPFAVAPPWPGAKSTGRRLALAKWVTQPDHPLTARVIVNRVWKHHFSEGLVKTLDNFGKAGAAPTHPELLDWLAVRLVENGWSLKDLHRQIVTSEVYRQSSQVSAAQEELDPDNDLLSRSPLRRMDGEVLRDTMLQLAGRLNATPFGPPDPVDMRKDGLVTDTPRGEGNNNWRRSIYLIKRRTQQLTMLQNFDFPRMNPNCVARSESVVAPQALHLNNNQRVRELAAAFALRVWDEARDDPDAQIDLAFRLATGGPPSDTEREIARQTLQEMTTRWNDAEPTATLEIVAKQHLWIRETEPDKVYEDDLISVWSSANSDQGRRYGLIEFDLEPLARANFTDAYLELGAIEDSPLAQVAATIPSGIEGCTWNSYQQQKSASARPLSGLGHYQFTGAARPNPGTYARSDSATSEDLAQLQSAARSTGKLTLVLMAAEDGTGYRQDWDDGTYSESRGNPPRLVVRLDERSSPDIARRKALENLCHALLNSAALLYID